MLVINAVVVVNLVRYLKVMEYRIVWTRREKKNVFSVPYILRFFSTRKCIGWNKWIEVYTINVS